MDTKENENLSRRRQRQNSTLTYVAVLLLLLFLLVLAFPKQSAQLITAFITVFENITSFGQIIIVALVIGLIVYLLRRAGKI